MLRFNTFRSERYLRSKFVEGKYLLASEATDLELEVLDLLRKVVSSTLGDVAIDDAFKVERLSATQIRIAPGQAWFKGLPFAMRGGKDQLVTGAVLSLGTVPVGTTATDDSTGLGKVITFNSGSTTPSALYRIIITAREELITEVDDPFLQNVNLTESTAQKIRLLFQLNIVPESLQSETPVPYRDEGSASGSVTNFPNTGGMAAPNYVNQIEVTGSPSGNGELLALNPISGSEGIDGRDLEAVVRNNPALGGGNPIPNSPTAQQAFSNGKLIDSYGNKYHVNAIFNDTVSTQVVIRLDKEPDQPNPQFVNGLPFTLVKREVYVTDDSNGVPQGRLHWPVATLDWSSTDGIVHESKVVDLRTSVSREEEAERLNEVRDNLKIVGGGDVSFDLTSGMLSWPASFAIVNPHGALQTIGAASAPLADGGSLAYEMDIDGGGVIGRGSLGVTVSSGGMTATLASVDLTDVRLGNILVDSAGDFHVITAIDNVNDTVSAATSIAIGAATIYMDSFGPGLAPLSNATFILAVRSGDDVLIGGENEEADSEDRNIKLTYGGKWHWYNFAANRLDWLSDAFIQVPGLPGNRNRIPAGNVNLNSDGDVAYVKINRSPGAPADLTVLVASISALVPSKDLFVIARRTNTDCIVGDSMLLAASSSSDLYAQASDQNLQYTGAGGTGAAFPQYSSNNYVNDNDDLTTSIGNLDAAVGAVAGAVRWKQPVANYAALPAVGNTDGDVRLVLDTRVAYSWKNSDSTWVEIGRWKSPVADAASLPTVDNLDGDVRLTLDTRVAYHWDQATTSWKPLNGTGGGVKIVGGGTVAVESGSAISDVFNFSISNTNAHDLGNYTSDLIIGPTFTPSQAGILQEIDVSLLFVSGTGNLRADIYELNTADPINLPPLSGILDTCNAINITTLPSVGGLNPTLTTLVFPGGISLDPSKMYGVYLYLDTPASAVNFNRAATGGGPSPQPHVVYKNFSTDNQYHVLQGSPGDYNAQTPIVVRALVASTDLALTFSAPLQLEMKGLDYSDNNIPLTESPITFTADGQVAYVIPNLTAGGSDLSVTVDTLPNVPANALIIARRDAGDVIVGSSSTRLKQGQSTELYAQESIQTRNTIRSTDFLRSDDPVTWTGTQLQFTSDIVLETLNTRLGSNDQWVIDQTQSPIALANGEVAYIAIDREDPIGTATVVVDAAVPTVTDENIEYIMLFKRVDANGAGYLHIPLHKQVLEPGQTVRLGASGSGSGNASEIVETVKNRLLDSTFDLATPNVFQIDTDSLVDPSSTGAYSLVTKTFDFSGIGQTLVTKQLLDATEFLANDNFLKEVELLAFWTQGSIDPSATYEVSRNGGNEWQSMSMSRVGSTELFRGVHTFSDEGSNQTLQQQALATSDGDNDLDSGSARQKLSQAFTVTSKQLVKSLNLRITKTGSPSGNYKASIYNDAAGSPGTSVLSESALLPVSGLSAGTNNVNVNVSDVILVPGTYHIVFEADAAYRASYSNGVTEIALRSLAAGTPVSKAYNGTAWSALTSKTVFEVVGIVLDLRVRITAGTASTKLDGYAVLYDRLPGLLATGVKELEFFQVNGSLNTVDFTVSNFQVNPELLRVYDVGSGQVYRYGAFTVNGNTVSFSSGQFFDPGNTITLIFDQTSGGTFDNNDANALLLATNHLGSSDATIDRSIAGRGIFLRRPDGTLREIAIDNNDNIVVYSV